MQDKILGFDFKWYFLFNIAVLVGVSLLLWKLVLILTGSNLAALVSALLLLIDIRSISSIYNIGERQSSLACLFGLGALLLTFGASALRPGIKWFLIVVLLSASALCKEFGLAFTAAVFVAAATDRSESRPVAGAAAATVVLTYVALRFGVAGGATIGEYCRPVGYFGRDRLLCDTNLIAARRISQYVYTAGASILGTPLPFLFNSHGALLSPKAIVRDTSSLPVVARSVAIAVTVGLAVTKCWRRTVPLLALVIANGALSFVLWRGRNQLVGLVGLYAACGLGTAVLLRKSAPPRRERYLALGLSVGLVIGSGYAMLTVNRRVSNAVTEFQQNPCVVAAAFADSIDIPLARELARRYGYSTVACDLATTERRRA